jgi:hypothetical protein
VQYAAVGRHQRDVEQLEGQGTGGLFGEEAAQRAAGKAHDFQRALDALGIVGFEAGRGVGVVARQFGVQRGPALRRGFGVDLRAQRGVGLRQFGEAFAQGFDIQHGAADQQRDAAGGADAFHFAQRVAAELRRRIAFFGRDQVDQPVREARQRRGVGLGGADVHVAEHLRRIDADDVAGKARGKLEGQRGLAAGGGADQQDGRRQGHQRPRMKSLSSSAIDSCTQVGRPWLHWSARSVASIWRSRAFISIRPSARWARTAPWQAMVASSSLRRASTTRLAGMFGQVAQQRAHQLVHLSARQQRRQAAHGDFARAGGGDLEAERGQGFGLVFHGGQLGRAGGKHQRHQQGLRRRRTGVEGGLELFVEDALMRGVHVDQHQPGGVLRQDVDAMQLRDGVAEQRGLRCQ